MKNQIQKDYLAARLNKDTVTVNLLSVIVGDIKKYEIDNRKDITNDQIISILKKVQKGVNDTLALRETEIGKREKEILESYLPKQLSKEEIVNILCNIDFNSMKEYMAYFKANYDGQYNGKELSSLVSDALDGNL